MSNYFMSEYEKEQYNKLNITNGDLENQLLQLTNAKKEITKHFGYNIQNGLANYKKALALSASQRVLVYCVGDSLTEGLFSSVEATKSWVGLVRSRLQSLYGNAGEGFISLREGGMTGGRWTLNPNTVLFGGYGFGKDTYYTNKLTGTLTCAAPTSTSISIPIGKYITGDSVPITIDGSGVADIPCWGTSTYDPTQFQTYSGLSSATHSVVISPRTNNNLFIEGLIANIGTTGIEVSRMGVAGSKSGDWIISQTYRRWAVRPPHLFIFGLGVNDAGGSIDIPTYIANMTSLIQQAKSIGADVLLVCYHQCQWAYSWYSYVKAIYTLADTYNCGLIDLYMAYNMSWDYANAMGYMGVVGAVSDYTGNSGTNVTHPGNKGYSIMADIITPHLML